MLSFFPRVETKLSFLFGLNVALLGLAFVNIALDQFEHWYTAIPCIAFLVIIALSFINLYYANYPDLRGGKGSLIYFQEIAARTESSFISEFSGASQKDLNEQVLAQVWRNAEILTQKFKRLQRAFLLTLVSLAPLTVFFLATAIESGALPRS